MNNPEVLTDEQLRAWDWQAALREEERSMAWLARQTRRGQTTVYAYSYGFRTPPLAWLREAARVLKRDVAA